MKYSQDLLMDAARKICRPDCFANYPTCKRCQESKGRKLPFVGTGTVCPLDRYNISVQPNQKRTAPTLEDCYCLCGACEHAEVKCGEEGEYIDRATDYEQFCLDCPVHMIEESILEAEAEARMS